MSMPPLPEDETQRDKSRLIEDVFIILCIPTLWPVVMGWSDPIFRIPLYIALAGLLFIFYRRIKRFKQARDDLKG